MRVSALLFTMVSAGFGAAGAACSNGGASGDAGAPDATADVVDNDGEPLICQQFTEAGAACSPASPVRCFACGDAGGGCYCQATPGGPRWKCLTDPSCFPCTLGDEGCAPDTAGDASSE